MSWSVEVKEKSGDSHDKIAKAITSQMNPDSTLTLAAILAYFQMVARDTHNNGGEVVMKTYGHVNGDGSGTWDIHVEVPTPVKT